MEFDVIRLFTVPRKTKVGFKFYTAGNDTLDALRFTTILYYNFLVI